MLLAAVIGAVIILMVTVAYTYRATARNESMRHHPTNGH